MDSRSLPILLGETKFLSKTSFCHCCKRDHEDEGEVGGSMFGACRCRDWICKRTKRVTQIARMQRDSLGE